jgi:hypothetical protein
MSRIFGPTNSPTSVYRVVFAVGSVRLADLAADGQDLGVRLREARGRQDGREYAGQDEK